MTDRNGTTHTYAYDALGRLTSDTITTLGSGVDGSIMRLGYTYNSQGLPYQQTSYSDTSGTNVVNQVEDVYNGLGQLTGEYQEHSGAVVATSSAEVTYAYTEMASGVNNSRMTSMTYPDGRIVHYGYNTGIDDAISRLSYTADDNGSGSAGVHLEDDQYLGLDTVVVRAHPQDGVDMSLIKQPSDTLASSDGGDQYTGLDRFGRVIDQNWITNDGSTNAASVDRYQYGYDADGNVLYKRNVTKSVFSELYTYDNLNQLGSYQRGILDSAGTSIASVAASQTYNLDPLGNRTSVSTTDADTVGGSVTNDYTTNAQNQIESMTDASGTNTASLGYDNDGNTLADDAGNTYTYDAWNRQATVSTSIQSGSNTVTVGETYGYDANGKRITSYVTGSAASGNTADNLYFSNQWQIVQETLVNTVGSGTNAVTTTTRNEYTWASGVYVNALIERDQTQTISPMGATNGLYASYFGAGSPNSLPVHETDSNINFDWSSTGPAALPSQGTNAFYVRWTGEVDAASAGAYTFNLGTGGDVEVKIDGKVVILLLDNPAGDLNGNGVNNLDDLNIFSSNFGKIVPPGTGGDFNDNGTVDLGDLNTFSSGSGDGSPQWTTSTASITLSAGEHNIEIDYFQPQGLSAGEAGITLSWVTPSNTNSVTIPTGSFTPQQSSTRLYAMQDANFNVTGFLDVNGDVVERVVYTPYGQATVLNADWSPSTATFGNDAVGWTIGFQGMRVDAVSGEAEADERNLDVRTGTWDSPDPMGYGDGADDYAFACSNPIGSLDPSGLQFIDEGDAGDLNISWVVGDTGGGHGNQALGDIQENIPPVIEVRRCLFDPHKFIAWVKDGTGMVTVVRSYTGIQAGDQGIGVVANRFLHKQVYVSEQLAQALDAHEAGHIWASEQIYNQTIKPAEDKAAEYHSAHSEGDNALEGKEGETKEELTARLLGLINWNASLQAFRDKDAAVNGVTGTFHAWERAQGGGPVDYLGAGTVSGVHYGDILKDRSETDRNYHDINYGSFDPYAP